MAPVVQTFLQLPLFAVILGAGCLFSVVLAGPVSRRWHEPWIVVCGLGVSLSLVLAATLTPAPGGASGPCIRPIVRPLGRGLLEFTDDRALNTWMLVPLGFFAGYLAVRRWWLLLLAFGVPFLVEGMQRFLPQLDRRCQFQDLIDNTWGLILGAVAGVLLGAATALFVERERR
jgi:VanZ family protein